MKDHIIGNYRVNLKISREQTVKQLVNEWVMQWVREFHPEALETAKNEINTRLDADEPIIIEELATDIS